MNAACDCGDLCPAVLMAGSLAYRASRLPAPHPRSARAESGQALLILIVTLSIATMLLVYGSTTEIERTLRADSRARNALEEAKQALIGRAVGDANRPGSLPCPDSGDDGSADLFVGSACPSYIGRLPWRTLGVGDLRDDSGERLWYALSPNFRDHPNAPPLNSDTKGTLTVYSNSDTLKMAEQAIAVVFAPGFALRAQRRDDGQELCATTGKTVERKRCAANYLDTAAGMRNAAASGPYIAARAGDDYNDRLAVIVAADLMPLVERRVTLELRNALLAYRAASDCACYPWADSGTDGVSDAGANRGRVPVRGALPQNWKPGVLPPYVVSNDWARVIYYAAARNALESGGSGCATCVDPTLTVDGVSGYDVVLVSAGYAGAQRPSPAMAAYFDDPENQDGDDRFVTPRSAGADRDRLYSILGAESGCAASARVLIDNAPCTGPAAGVRAVCQSASAALARCTCSAAAASMTRAPCVSALDAPACELAMTQLRGCVL
ncbi:MAG: hypothetical protein JWO70_1623 [Betaproteobacteria bacterium]|nr:hypothetical protein [Betaproteobacteria bacterium]